MYIRAFVFAHSKQFPVERERESLQMKYTVEKVRVGMRGRINKYLLKSIKVLMLGHPPEFELPAPRKFATNRIYIHFASGREGDP